MTVVAFEVDARRASALNVGIKHTNERNDHKTCPRFSRKHAIRFHESCLCNLKHRMEPLFSSELRRDEVDPK
jgi:hypothetical protein